MKLKTVLPIIILSQFLCTTLWFAGNGVMNDLVMVFDLPTSAIGHLTSAVQFGFIAGTLLFALLSIADRFSPSQVFFVSALLAATANYAMIFPANSLATLIFWRFLTGFFLAGIYPVGMKIAADHYEKGLGKSLGFLVGALVMGTAFPHLLRIVPVLPDWKTVITLLSFLSTFGGMMILLFVPNGPYRKRSMKPNNVAILRLFRKPAFRASAMGYFGHMWELYAFWAFTPVILQKFAFQNDQMNSWWSFLTIAIGSLFCMIGGLVASRFSERRVAFFALTLSGISALVSGFILQSDPIFIVIFLLLWGAMVIPDSPMFSTLIARSAAPELRGTALTLVNGIGFLITVISIELLNWMVIHINSPFVFTILGIGPLIGLLFFSFKE